MSEIEQSLKRSTPPPTKVRELCELTGVSERSLQYLFMWKYGFTPMAYLKQVRLNYARKQLHRATSQKQKVSDVANQMAFWHMGQFARTSINYSKNSLQKPCEEAEIEAANDYPSVACFLFP